MDIGKLYNLSLQASISNKLRLVHATLVGITDSSNPAVTPVITEHNTSVYRLPATLKAIDIYQQKFYYFRESGTDGVIVIPEAYINVSSIVEVSQLTRTLVFTLANTDELARLVATLNDGEFQYRLI